MSKLDSLTVYTVPSNHLSRVGDIISTTVRPYPRIVGHKIPEGILWLPREVEYDPKSAFNQSDAEERVLPSTPEMSSRFTGIFEKFMGDDLLQFTCFTFAFLMSGKTTLSHPAAIYEAENFIRKGHRLSTRLELGQIGIFGGVYREFKGVPEPDHGVVGLGQDREDCLMVSGPQGHIGIGDYDEISYRFMGSEEGRKRLRWIANYGLWSIEVPSYENETYMGREYDD